MKSQKVSFKPKGLLKKAFAVKLGKTNVNQDESVQELGKRPKID